MNFRFIDDTVRGIVSFAFGLLIATATMLVRPLGGAPRLHRSSRRGALQVSGLSYLAATMILAVAFLPNIDRPDDRGGATAGLLDVGRFVATGGASNSILPLLAGAIGGTVLIEAVLRLVGARLTPFRRERFVATLEYQFGLFVLGCLVLISVVTFGEPPDWTASLVFPIFLLMSVPLAIQFYTLGCRNSTMGRWRRSLRWVHLRADATTALRRIPREPSKALLSLWNGGTAVLTFLFVVALGPALIGVAGLLTATLGARWLEQDGNRAVITIIGLNCDIASAKPTARAVAWNATAIPLAGWLGNLRLRAFGIDMFYNPVEADPGWRPALPAGRAGDLLRPGEAIELSGPLDAETARDLDGFGLRETGCRPLGGAGNIIFAGADGRLIATLDRRGPKPPAPPAASP